MSKINVHDFLELNGENKQYAIVEYDGKRKAVCYFNNDSKDAMYVNCKDKWSGFSLTLGYKTLGDTDNIEEECLSIVESLLKPDTDRKIYYEQYIKPMIIDNVYWEILYVENIELRPPNEVDSIILITEKECLKYLMDVEYRKGVESVNSLKLKQEIKSNIANDLKQSNDFDSVAIDKIMEVFDKVTAECTFQK